MKNNKRLLALLSLTSLLLVVSCVDNGASVSKSEEKTEEVTPSTSEKVEVKVDNGTEAAKILLAQERLDSSVMKSSNGLFTKGKKAFSKIASETRKYSRKQAKIENETYTEVEGDVIKWYNDVDYSNFNFFFKSYATDIEFQAERGSKLIDDTKKYIRVVDKWVNVGGTQYLLDVNENDETIYSRSEGFIDICRRYTDELGHDVYETLYLDNGNSISRTRYIPGLVYEYATQIGDFTHYLFAENYKGYWTVNSTSGLTLDYQSKEYITFNSMVLKEEACYQFSTTVYGDSVIGPNSMTIISNDHQTDLLEIGVNKFGLFNTGIEGLDHLKIEATEEQRGVYYNDPEKDKNTVVYVQDNLKNDGTPYKIYSTSGVKSATAVLENGIEFTKGDTFLDGKITTQRIDVSYVAGCDAYGRIPFSTTATTIEENYELIKQFLTETGITFRRDLEEVFKATDFAVNDVIDYMNYYKWNGYSVNELSQVKLAFEVEEAKTEKLVSDYYLVKDIKVIGFDVQEATNKNMYFSNVTLEKDMVVSNDGFTITLTEAEVKVLDTLLFVDKEKYSLVLALQSKEGSIIPLHIDENSTSNYSEFTKGSEFKTTQAMSVSIPVLDEGEYGLVAYVATHEEGIRVTNPIEVKGTFTEATYITTGITQTLSTNEDGNLLITSVKTNDVYLKFEGTLTYDNMVNFMSENAYQYGAVGEVVIEQLVDGNWVVVEKPVVKEETQEQTETEEQQPTGETEVVSEQLEEGQYRMKYIVTNVTEETEEETTENTSVEEYGYVFVTLTIAEESLEDSSANEESSTEEVTQ